MLRGRVTAWSGMRKDPLTLAASRWPSCTRRYTVRFETRIIAATSKIVRNLVPAGETGAPGIMPPTEPEVPEPTCTLTQLHSKWCCKLQCKTSVS